MLPFPEALGQKRGDALGGVSVCVLVGQLCELQALGPQRIVARCKLLKKHVRKSSGVSSMAALSRSGCGSMAKPGCLA